MKSRFTCTAFVIFAFLAALTGCEKEDEESNEAEEQNAFVEQSLETRTFEREMFGEAALTVEAKVPEQWEAGEIRDDEENIDHLAFWRGATSQRSGDSFMTIKMAGLPSEDMTDFKANVFSEPGDIAEQRKLKVEMQPDDGTFALGYYGHRSKRRLRVHVEHNDPEETFPIRCAFDVREEEDIEAAETVAEHAIEICKSVKLTGPLVDKTERRKRGGE